MSKKPLYIFLHLPKNGGTTVTKNLRKVCSEDEIIPDSYIKKLTLEQKSKVKFLYGHSLAYGIHEEFPDRSIYYILLIRNPAERIISQYNHEVNTLSSKSKPSFKKWYKMQLKNEQVFLCAKKFRGEQGRKTPEFTKRYVNKPWFYKSKTLKTIGYKILKVYLSFKSNKKSLLTDLEQSKKLVEKCWFVGLTENLDVDLPKLFQKMGYELTVERYRTAKNDDATVSKNKMEVRKTIVLTEELRNKLYQDNSFDCKLYEHIKKGQC